MTRADRILALAPRSATPQRRFAGLTAIAAVMRSLYSAAIGIGFGAWFTGNPFLAVVVGLALAGQEARVSSSTGRSGGCGAESGHAAPDGWQARSRQARGRQAWTTAMLRTLSAKACFLVSHSHT